jgi:hypothetical protein
MMFNMGGLSFLPISELWIGDASSAPPHPNPLPRFAAERETADILECLLKSYNDTITLNPPYNMRFISNGMFFELHISESRGSFINFAHTLSRCARDL